MTELYVLEGIKEEELTNLIKKNSSEFITFDYESHKKLSDRNIHHKLIDDYITDLDRREIFDFSNRCLKKIEEFNESALRFHDINLVNLIDRNDAEIIDSMYMFADLRTKKSDSEIKLIEKAVSIAEKSLNSIIHKLNSGISEKDFASQLVIELLNNGSESELPFSPIVASGANGANPHHFPTDKVIGDNELVIIDWGANYQGYFSDITRTFATGNNIDSKLLDAFESVRLANSAARAKSKHGVTAGDVDLAARSIIDERGFGDFFIHRTGHGLGLEIHEEPNIKQNEEFILTNGNIYTIEPGIYLPELGGIRIEDDVLIESSGSRSLTTISRNLVYL